MLELGCGTGTTALRMAQGVRRYTGCDYAAEMIAIAREKSATAGPARLAFCRAACGDGTLPHGPFDVVLSFNLLHLLHDREASLQEVRDRLPDQGVFISITPCLGGVFRVFKPLMILLGWMGKAPDIQFFSSKQLAQEILSAGFEIIETGDYPNRPPSRLIVARKL